MKKRYEDFCKAFVANGDKAAEAYKAAGYKVGSKHTAEASAFKLLKKAEIQQRIAELKGFAQKASMDAMVMTVQAKREKLAEIITDPETNVFAKMKAIDIDNKMEGVYVTKTELSGAGGGPLVFAWEGESDA